MTLRRLRAQFVAAAVLISSSLSAQRPPPQPPDVLILRDGGRRMGSLETCVADGCVFSGQSVGRETISWIGLSPVQPSPPPPSQPAVDEIHLADDSIQTGPVMTVNSQNVVTQSGSQRRSLVRWIHFAESRANRSCWTGTVTSHSAYQITGPGMMCSADWTGALSMPVDETGRLTGQATFALSAITACPNQAGGQFPQVQGATFAVTGVATPQQLVFQFSGAAGSMTPGSGVDATGLIGSMVDPISGRIARFSVPITSTDNASGDVSLRNSVGPNIYESTNSIVLVRKRC